METRVLTAHVPLDLANKVDEIAQRRDRFRGWILKQALSAWVAQEEDRYRLTLESLAEVEAGKLIDHAEVERWALSLDTAEVLCVPPCR